MENQIKLTVGTGIISQVVKLAQKKVSNLHSSCYVLVKQVDKLYTKYLSICFQTCNNKLTVGTRISQVVKLTKKLITYLHFLGEVIFCLLRA